MKKVISMMVASTFLITATSAMALENQPVAKNAATETTPENMTCQEFIDLNPKSYTPVAFWFLNEDTQYKHGDTVDFHEVDVVVTPKLITICEQSPKTRLAELKDKMKGFFKKNF